MLNKLFNWVIGLFVTRDKEFDKEVKMMDKKRLEQGFIDCQLLSFSDASYVCSMAAKVCIGKEVDENYEARLNHISRVVGRGHESTIAQSNIVMLLSFDSTYAEAFLKVANAFKFLNFTTKKTDDDRTVVLIGGSIRAYKYFIREVEDFNNPICRYIINTLYISAEKEFFEDLIADGIMIASNFTFFPAADLKTELKTKYDESGEEYEEKEATSVARHQKIVKGKYADIIYSDDPYSIMDKVEFCGFTLRDVLKVTSLTILFHDFSRSTSQQITRHFAGISQESQRYVDYSNSVFINPLQFNPKYDMDKEYEVELFGTKKNLKAEDLGTEMIKVYNQLINQDMLKQDARGFLIFNVATKVLMTFTFADYFHFVKERTSTAAQPEVQAMTKESCENLSGHEGSSTLFQMNLTSDLIQLVESPKYKLMELEQKKLNDSVDEVMSEEVIK